jgi:hypothetical protein
LARAGKIQGIAKKQPEQLRLVLLPAGGVARSLRFAGDLRLTSALPAAKIPAQ